VGYEHQLIFLKGVIMVIGVIIALKGARGSPVKGGATHK
jgi:hypothetical protein